MTGDTTLDSNRLLIKGLARQRTRMLLSLPGLDRQPALIVNEGMTDEGYTFVTLLTPQTPTLWLPPDTEVEAEGRLHGAHVQLRSHLHQLRRNDDEWQLDVAWPHRVMHMQRRQAFRADVPPEHPMAQARLCQGNAEPVSAVVIDISLTGVGLQPPRQWTPNASEPLRCEWSRSSTQGVSLPLEIRHLSRSANGTHLGARFERPTADSLHQLRQWVVELERHWLRRRQGVGVASGA